MKDCGESSMSRSLRWDSGQAQPLTSAVYDPIALFLGAKSRLTKNSCITQVVPVSSGNWEAAPSPPVRAQLLKDPRSKKNQFNGGDTTAWASLEELETALVWGYRHKNINRYEKIGKLPSFMQIQYRGTLCSVSGGSQCWGRPRRGYKKHAGGCFLLSVPQV